jgi:hypothetical protein
MFVVYITMCCVYDRVWALCMMLCDDKVIIFNCGACVAKMATKHMWCGDETLFSHIQTIWTSIWTDATQKTKHWAKSSPWPIRDTQEHPSQCVLNSDPPYQRCTSSLCCLHLFRITTDPSMPCLLYMISATYRLATRDLLVQDLVLGVRLLIQTETKLEYWLL